MTLHVMSLEVYLKEAFHKLHLLDLDNPMPINSEWTIRQPKQVHQGIMTFNEYVATALRDLYLDKVGWLSSK